MRQHHLRRDAKVRVVVVARGVTQAAPEEERGECQQAAWLLGMALQALAIESRPAHLLQELELGGARVGPPEWVPREERRQLTGRMIERRRRTNQFGEVGIVFDLRPEDAVARRLEVEHRDVAVAQLMLDNVGGLEHGHHVGVIEVEGDTGQPQGLCLISGNLEGTRGRGLGHRGTFERHCEDVVASHFVDVKPIWRQRIGCLGSHRVHSGICIGRQNCGRGSWCRCRHDDERYVTKGARGGWQEK